MGISDYKQTRLCLLMFMFNNHTFEISQHPYFSKLQSWTPLLDVSWLPCINSYSASHDNWCTVGGDGGCRVGEVRAGTTSPMPDHKGFKLQ